MKFFFSELSMSFVHISIGEDIEFIQIVLNDLPVKHISPSIIHCKQFS